MWSNLHTLDEYTSTKCMGQILPEILRLKQTFDVLFSVDAQAQQPLIRQVHQLHAIYASLSAR